ncbi:hypothetical protein FA95DRAFT_1675443 [Auriscalpium vulgare]|uniref:Uncharacterized protein n=1 Tax=Auriscalpium vulgare TaxID=40419 RepID=A0ACB8S8J0_9AGAM|nr:hypothetical protein FA95DRAFT_1675443 [Auriscalpium vulgare]
MYNIWDSDMPQPLELTGAGPFFTASRQDELRLAEASSRHGSGGTIAYTSSSNGQNFTSPSAEQFLREFISYTSVEGHPNEGGGMDRGDIITPAPARSTNFAPVLPVGAGTVVREIHTMSHRNVVDGTTATAPRPNGSASAAVDKARAPHHWKDANVLVHSPKKQGSHQLKPPNCMCWCGSRVFARVSDLDRHQKTSPKHNARAKFLCEACLARFTRKDALLRHQRKQHGSES